MRLRGTLLIRIISFVALAYGLFGVLSYGATLALFPLIQENEAAMSAMAQSGQSLGEVAASIVRFLIGSISMCVVGVLSLMGAKRSDRTFLLIAAIAISVIWGASTVVVWYQTDASLTFDTVIALVVPLVLLIGALLNWLSRRAKGDECAGAR